MDKKLQKTIDTFFSKFQLLSYKKGDALLRAGEQPIGVSYLKKGLVRMYMISPVGEVFVIHVFRPGSFFPMMWVVNQTPNTYYYEAMTAASVYRAPASIVQKFVKENPDVLYRFTSRILSGLSGILRRMESLVTDGAYAKTAMIISYFAKRYGQPEKDRIVLPFPLAHREIAAWVGTSRETVSLQMEALVKGGLIAYRGRTLLVKNLRGLEKVADQFKSPAN